MNTSVDTRPHESEEDFGGHPAGKPRKRKVALLAIATTAFLVAGLLAAPNAGAGAIAETISGTALPSDCNGSEGVGALAMTGDLEGCLIFNPRHFDCTELNGFDLYEERGTELFRGSYKGSRGVFRTFYTLSATFASGSCDRFAAGDLPFDAQMTGGCDHAITGTRGVFQGLSGNFNIFDVIADPGTSGATDYHYAGYLK